MILEISSANQMSHKYDDLIIMIMINVREMEWKNEICNLYDTYI